MRLKEGISSFPVSGVVMDYLIAYEFYVKGKNNSSHLIGILPERRRTQERITYESVMNWGKMYLGEPNESQKLYCVRVEIEKSTGEIKESHWLTPKI